jgi:GPH family glycoside/pentoside/hexuronide:cation symporter
VRRVMWFYLFNAIAVAIPATLVLFYIDDVVQMPDQAGLFLGLYFLAGMLTLPVWVAVSDRIGKARAWLAGTCMAVLALFFSGWVGTGDGLLYGLICLVSGAALGADVALPPAMLADAIPKGHRQSTGLYFGIWVLIGKFALAVAAGVALPSLKLLDYQPGQPATTGSLIVLYVFLPMIFKALATLALLPKFGEQFFSRVFARKVSSP